MNFPFPVPRGRESRPASTPWIVVKTLWHAVTFTSLFFGLIPLVFVEIEKSSPLARWRFVRPFLRVAASFTFLAFAALGTWSILVMAVNGRGTMLPVDCAPRLVRGGPYRLIRNPMVVAGLGQAFSVGVWHGSPLVLLYALAAALARHLVLQPWEDADLEARFGDEWRQYKEQVSQWWPRFPPAH
ncbi:MAG: hypothetical protein KY445_04860 [Armatimonadetes bacterium]|nr:hypothetical protein [Armatimonadota bacterium]